jgi:hypothetical protein
MGLRSKWNRRGFFGRVLQPGEYKIVAEHISRLLREHVA